MITADFSSQFYRPKKQTLGIRITLGLLACVCFLLLIIPTKNIIKLYINTPTLPNDNLPNYQERVDQTNQLEKEISNKFPELIAER